MAIPACNTGTDPVVAAVALGGNLGDVPRTFQQAIARLRRTDNVKVLRCSGNYQTRAIGSQAGADYFNAAIELETTLSPRALLTTLQEIETGLGRVRTGHWSPRTLDLDLLSYGSEVIDEPDSPHPLSVPHPACWYRRFVLDPWNEIAPEWRHPLLNETVSEMRERLKERPLPFRLTGEPDECNLLRVAILASFANHQLHQISTGRAAVEFRIDSHCEKENQFHSSDRVFFVQPRDGASETAILTLRAMLDTPVRCPKEPVPPAP